MESLKMNKKRNLLTSVLIGFLIFNVAKTWAEPAVTRNVKYYSIMGRTADDLRNSMNQNRKKLISQPYDGYTEWYVSWRFNFNKNSALCQLSSVTTFVTVNFYMPKWEHSENANQMLRDQWEEFYNGLRDHELGHKKFAVDAAAEIEKELPLQITVQDNCHKVNAEANRLAEQIIEKYRRREKEYDALTKHGKTQGAIFPP